jgi:hypothetical protein
VGTPSKYWRQRTVVIPLWLVEATDAPHWLLAWLWASQLGPLLDWPSGPGGLSPAGQLCANLDIGCR